MSKSTRSKTMVAKGGVDRRQALAAGGAAAAGIALGARKSFAADMAPVATTTAGKIRGYANGPVKVFKGIPYGASTAGANRFMAPKPPTPWAGVRDATKLGDKSPQLPTKGIMEEEIVSLDKSPMSEDCLVLNLWTAGLRDGGKRPIMVWFHGGGFTQGSGGDVRYDGSNLARKDDVVVVTVNHRLNAFGFLYLAEIGGEKYADSGNAGTLDIVAALQWVHDNAHEFGGDPGNVTVFGQSGGGGKVTTLMGMPPAKGLFHRVIAESGLNIRAETAAAGTKTAERLLANLGIKHNELDKLHAVPFQKIVDAMVLPPGQGLFGGLNFSPILDGRSLTVNPFDPVASSLAADVPMILGSTLTEVTFLNTTPLDPIDAAMLHNLVKQNTHSDDAEADKLIALYKNEYPGASDVRIYQLLASDNWMTANVALVAARKAALGKAPAYVYHFEKTTPVHDGKLVCPHTLEIPYVFDNLDVPTAALVTGTGKDRYPLADKMSRAWTTFARTGNPNVSGLPNWPAYSAADREVMVFNDECKVVKNPHAAEREAIDEIHKRMGMPA